MNDLRFKGPPPGREAIEAAIQTLIDLLDAMTPDSDFELADDSWEGDDREDMEPDDHYGGDVCDEPHDQDSEIRFLNRDAAKADRFYGDDQRFVQHRVAGMVMTARSYGWEDAAYPARQGGNQ